MFDYILELVFSMTGAELPRVGMHCERHSVCVFVCVPARESVMSMMSVELRVVFKVIL
jgi:hypothetical protein